MGSCVIPGHPLSIVGWIYDPDHSFVVSAHVSLTERKPALAWRRHHILKIEQVPGRSRQPIQVLQDQHVSQIQPCQQFHELGVGRAPLDRLAD
jgi:hypothetical protein